MKAKHKIYGVPGMLEYQALIKVGTAKMRINFTNGSTNEAGKTPATFHTDNFIVQHAIENSVEYKTGKIVIVHSADTKEDVYIESEHVAHGDVSVREKKQVGEVADVADAKDVAVGSVVESETAVSGDVVVDAPSSEDVVVEKSFTCSDDAKDFFEQEYGVKRSSMRLRSDIVAVGKKYGISVVFSN